MHTIKRRGFIDTKASRLLVVAPLVHRCDIYFLANDYPIFNSATISIEPRSSRFQLFAISLYISVYPNEPIRSFPSSKRSRKSSGEFQRLLLSKFFFELAQKNSSLSSMQVSNPWSNYITKNSGINSLYSKWKMTMVNESVGNLTW